MVAQFLYLMYWLCLCFMAGAFFNVAAQRAGSEITIYAATVATALLSLAVRATVKDLE